MPSGAHGRRRGGPGRESARANGAAPSVPLRKGRLRRFKPPTGSLQGDVLHAAGEIAAPGRERPTAGGAHRSAPSLNTVSSSQAASLQAGFFSGLEQLGEARAGGLFGVELLALFGEDLGLPDEGFGLVAGVADHGGVGEGVAVGGDRLPGLPFGAVELGSRQTESESSEAGRPSRLRSRLPLAGGRTRPRRCGRLAPPPRPGRRRLRHGSPRPTCPRGLQGRGASLPERHFAPRPKPRPTPAWAPPASRRARAKAGHGFQEHLVGSFGVIGVGGLGQSPVRTPSRGET